MITNLKIEKEKERPQHPYFLDFPSCIENLGVVPDVRFLAFLLVPAFLALRSLIVLVTLVLDIIYLPTKNYLFKFKLSNTDVLISKNMQFVKAIITIIFINNLCFGAAHTNYLSGNSSNKDINESKIISIGEHLELSIPNLKKFTIGNNDIISHKFNPKSKKLLIKGKKLGFTEIIIWRKKQSKKKIQIYVLSKQKHLKILHLAQIIKRLGLNVKIVGPLIIVDGTINEISNYRLIKKLQINNKWIHIRGELHTDLKNKIIGEIYNTMFNEYVDQISCSSEFLTIYCTFSKQNMPSPKVIQNCQQRYFVKFTPIKSRLKQKNFLLKLKIIQMERIDGKELNFGISKLTSTLAEIFSLGLSPVIKRNNILLAEQNIELSTLAEPELIIRIDDPGKIELGSTIPFKTGKKKNSAIEWKFAGLKIKITLKQFGGGLKIEYETELTKPDHTSSNITGSKESSSCLIDLNDPLLIFQIGLKTNATGSEGLPWLMNIPILGTLFKSKTTMNTYKQISGILILEEYE